MNGRNGRLEAAGFKQSLQLLATAAAELQFNSVVEHDDVVTVEVLLEFADSLDVDDCGAMDSQELRGLKLGFDLVHGFAQQVALTTHLELYVVVLSLDVIDLIRFQKEDPPARFD